MFKEGDPYRPPLIGNNRGKRQLESSLSKKTTIMPDMLFQSRLDRIRGDSGGVAQKKNNNNVGMPATVTLFEKDPRERTRQHVRRRRPSRKNKRLYGSACKGGEGGKNSLGGRLQNNLTGGRKEKPTTKTTTQKKKKKKKTTQHTTPPTKKKKKNPPQKNTPPNTTQQKEEFCKEGKLNKWEGNRQRPSTTVQIVREVVNAGKKEKKKKVSTRMVTVERGGLEGKGQNKIAIRKPFSVRKNRGGWKGKKKNAVR